MKNFRFNGKLYGINIRYYNNDNCSIMDKSYYKNNKREGEYIYYYYPSGKIVYKYYYKNDKIEGDFIVYDDYGKRIG
jgi:antitoxin component YwqK of YwqJK toxin-antitoxin module